MDALGQAAVFTTVILVMLIGLLGIILPVLPGLVLIWLGVLVFAIYEGFRSIDPITFSVLTMLTIVGVSADLWMSQLGAKMGGARFKSQLAGLAGGILGALSMVFISRIGAGVGAIIGSIAGVLAAEYHYNKEWPAAIKAGAGWFLGWLASTIFQFVIGGIIFALFVWQAFRG
ncbi:MAG: DUF456 domain-containing protein [Anaerolineales bacterium]|nr:DUF456 domain-containing protein [Anaerolineales bacterium]